MFGCFEAGESSELKARLLKSREEEFYVGSFLRVTILGVTIKGIKLFGALLGSIYIAVPLFWGNHHTGLHVQDFGFRLRAEASYGRGSTPKILDRSFRTYYYYYDYSDCYYYSYLKP